MRVLGVLQDRLNSLFRVFTQSAFARLGIAEPPLINNRLIRMNAHKTSRLAYLRRLEVVQDTIERGWSTSEAARAHGIGAVTDRK